MPKCKSCKAEIRFVRMESGKSMPVDPKMLAARPPEADEKTEVLITAAGATIRGVVCELDYSRSDIRWPCFRPHWASCPHADRHRKR